MRSFEVETSKKTEVVDVTTQVEDAVAEVSRQSEDPVEDEVPGVCTVFVRHTTAGVLVQESESNLVSDIESYLEDVVPDEGHAHDALDGNADSHLRAALVGCDVSVPVEDDGLALGTWQSVLLVECDGPRSRTVEVVVR